MKHFSLAKKALFFWRFSETLPRVPSFLRNRPNVAFPLFSRVQNFRGYIYRGNIRSAGPGLITRSVTFYSPMETPRTIGKPISPKSRDILPAALESVLRRARQTQRPFDTLVRKYRRRQNSIPDGDGKKGLAPAFRRDPRPHFHEFGITRGDVTGVHAAHGAPRHPRARIRTRGAPAAAAGWKRVQSPF